MKATSALLILLASAALTRAEPALQPNDVLAICGDSITEQKIYSAYVEDYLLLCQPVAGLRIVQFGWGGETAGGFLSRLDNDVLPFKPTVATTCYGMNDGGYAAPAKRTEDAYRQAMTSATKKLKAAGVRAVVVGSPGCVDATGFVNRSVAADVYNQTLGGLRGIAQEIARQEGTRFADVYTPMLDVMSKSKAAYGDAYVFVAGGGVHPNNNGQLVMAYAFLKALGCDGDIGTLTVDLAANQATGTPGQQIVSFQGGTLTVKSTRGPFCFQGASDKPDQDTACVVRFFPFNEELNRYLLVVKGIHGTKARVTWGDQTKEFTATELASGVNLASAFLVNPFCERFLKIHHAVQAQQTLETTLVKSFLHNLPAFTAMVPTEADDLQKVAAGGVKRDREMFDAAQALVQPVEHTIRIEAEP